MTSAVTASPARTVAVVAVVAAAIAGLVLVLAGCDSDDETGRAEAAGPTAPWMPSPRGDRVELWAVGDADGPGGHRVARLIKDAQPDRVLYVGDVYPRGTAADYRRWARIYDRLVQRMAPTPGNHEWPRAGEGYKRFWKRVRGRTPPSHYGFRAAGWQVLSVNSVAKDLTPARRWLRRRASGGGTCRIGFWHTPRYNAGRHGDNPRVRGLWNALKERAALVINGHDHNLQRMHPRDGIVGLISGAGGRHLYPVHEGDPRLAFSNETDYGALRLVLEPGLAEWEFVAASGQVLDSGTVECDA